MVDLLVLSEQYAGSIVVVFLAIYVLRGVYRSRISRLDSALIDSLDAIAAELDRKASLESAVKKASDLPNKAGPLFKEIILTSLKGVTFEDALNQSRATAKSRTFAYICELLATAYRSKANAAPSLKELGKKLWQIQHLEQTITSKSAGPIMILQILGVFLLPLIYYFLATLLQTETLNTVALVTSPVFTIYLGIVALAMAGIDLWVFRDLRETLWFLPVAASFFFFVMVKAGPYIIQQGGLFG